MSDERGRRAFRVAYDGQPFHGFQRQPDVPTVEDALFDALRDLDLLADDADAPEGYAAAGRTDAGVSARAQTVAFDAPEWLSPAAFNGELPPSIRTWASSDVPADFHATHNAASREYVYFLYAPTDSARSGDAFDDDHARETLARLAGEYDFHNLTPDDEGTVRDLDASAERDGEFLVVRLEADGFARQLVRRVVGLVAEIGQGDFPPSKVERVLADDPLDGPDGVAPAPAAPLVLWNVEYGLDWVVEEAAAANARAVFGEHHATRLASARVAGEIRDGIE